MTRKIQGLVFQSKQCDFEFLKHPHFCDHSKDENEIQVTTKFEEALIMVNKYHTKITPKQVILLLEKIFADNRGMLKLFDKHFEPSIIEITEEEAKQLSSSGAIL